MRKKEVYLEPSYLISQLPTQIHKTLYTCSQRSQPNNGTKSPHTQGAQQPTKQKVTVLTAHI